MLDLVDLVEEYQNSTYNFALNYSVVPTNRNEYNCFIDFLKENEIGLPSGKDIESIGYVDKMRFCFVKINDFYFITYEKHNYLHSKTAISVKDFLEKYMESEK